ncbi:MULTISPECIES: hypothetical protein [Methylobacterium]|jgi:hypothetical protein|uniref:hypothetical protein n=1 Tax=Methylobacterium TaxID=407 RepID=UPI0008C3D26C|nr:MULTISPECIES: hypothetical protein [Methylobacterium]MBK3397790.1 hypothetical protein [Methylobacterium ajmalii]MBK3410218.1 hypothetical protein [Methylobacterium ajmalii]MBK3423949.1 hypothetical protein [Methylobacterium ajmalii]MBZ6414574.1 hypothetical protein [Methylobacterium sp.]SEP39952.1 hypothetical protein SAMN04487843_11590 [Methylobacterium sp. ap11]
MIPHDHDLAQARAIPGDVVAAAEEVFATAIRDFITEFCLLDGSVLIGWVRGERHGNIADLVASSAEPFFKDATLTYADASDVCLDWGRSMKVVLDMEFAAKSVTVFFKLVLDGCFVGVAIQRILAEDAPPLRLDAFARALSDARLSA